MEKKKEISLHNKYVRKDITDKRRKNKRTQILDFIPISSKTQPINERNKRLFYTRLKQHGSFSSGTGIAKSEKQLILNKELLNMKKHQEQTFKSN